MATKAVQNIEERAEGVGASPAVDQAKQSASKSRRHMHEAGSALKRGDARAAIASVVRGLGAAAITIALVIVVLNQVFTLDIVANTSGPFDVGTIEGPTAGALSLLALAILVGGARIVMGQMGGGGGGGL